MKVLYPCPGFLSSAAWSSMSKKHHNGLIFIFINRAVNNGLLDTYQLKSLDGLLEASIEDAKVVKKDGKLFIELDDDDREASTYANPALKEGYDNFDNFALRDGYDKIIRCLGFRFNDSLFNE